MKAEKIIETKLEIDIDVAGVTLLSAEEYEKYKALIPLVQEWWWLRSPHANTSVLAGLVDLDGWVNNNRVDSAYGGTRPALILNSSSSNLAPGDVFEVHGQRWTVLGDGLAICNAIIEKGPFRQDWKAKDANDFEASDIKRRLEDWWEMKGQNG